MQLDWFPSPDVIVRRPLAGRIAEVIPLIFGRARIVISRDLYTVDDGW